MILMMIINDSYDRKIKDKINDIWQVRKCKN